MIKITHSKSLPPLNLELDGPVFLFDQTVTLFFCKFAAIITNSYLFTQTLYSVSLLSVTKTRHNPPHFPYMCWLLINLICRFSKNLTCKHTKSVLQYAFPNSYFSFSKSISKHKAPTHTYKKKFMIGFETRKVSEIQKNNFFLFVYGYPH